MKNLIIYLTLLTVITTTHVFGSHSPYHQELQMQMDTCNTPCPDLAPTLTLLPNVVQGVSPMVMIFDIREIENVDTRGPIVIRMPDNEKFQFTYDPTLTSLGFSIVNNKDWLYVPPTPAPGPKFHMWVFVGKINGHATSSIGIKGTFDPQGADGVATFTATVIPYSGSECNPTNNTKGEELEYFSTGNTPFQLDETIGNKDLIEVVNPEVTPTEIKVNVYPNPIANGQTLTVDFESTIQEELQISLYTTDGKQIQTYPVNPENNKQVSIEIDQLPQGNYLLQIQGENGIKTTKKLVVIGH